MKTFEQLYTQVMSTTSEKRAELDQQQARFEKLQSRQKSMTIGLAGIASVVAVIAFTLWCKLAIISSLDNNAFAHIQEQLGKSAWKLNDYVISPLDLASILLGLVISVMVWIIVYFGIKEAIIDSLTTKTEDRIESLEKEIYEKASFVVRPLAADLFGQVLYQFEIPNQKELIETMEQKLRTANFLKCFNAQDVPLLLYWSFNKELAKKDGVEYLLQSLEVIEKTPANKLGEKSFFVEAELQKITPTDEGKNFTLTPTTYVFQVDADE
jgi:hypothetical protein